MKNDDNNSGVIAGNSILDTENFLKNYATHRGILASEKSAQKLVTLVTDIV